MREMPYYYILYDWRQEQKAEAFCRKLKKKGFRCWFAGRDAPGRRDPEVLQNAMLQARAVIVFLTEGADASRQVADELQFALRCGMEILFCRDEGVSAYSAGYGLSLSSSEILSADSLTKELEKQSRSGKEKKPDPGNPGHPSFWDLFRRKKKEKTSSPESEHPPEKPAGQRANFSVLSPKVVKPDSYGLVGLYMYTDRQRRVVEEALEQARGLAEETSKNGFDVAHETAVTVRLESPDARIDDPMETQTWRGEALHFDFRFYLDAGFSKSQAAFTCYVECSGIPVTRLNFLVAVSSASEAGTIPARVTRKDYHRAFISYSRKDEQRMLSRVLSIQAIAPEMAFWLDKQSLDAGDFWRDEIRKAILNSDVLLLFWSVPASRSEEVKKEWFFAYEKKGLSFIAPVPLDPPDQCPPPDELKELNFTVRAFSTNDFTRQLNIYDGRSILLVSGGKEQDGF